MKKIYKFLFWLFSTCFYSNFAYSSPSFLEKSVEPVGPCTTPSCKNAVQKLGERMDPTAEPCDDFYKFVCGNSMDSTNSNNETSFSSVYAVAEMQKKIQSQLIKILEKDNPENDTKPMKIIKNLYKNCINPSTIEKQGLAPFLKIMEQFGGWPVLKGETWNETAFDWTKLIFKLGDESYWDTTFLPLIFWPDHDSNNTRSSIYVYEPFWKTPEILLKDGVMNDNAKKYFEFMVDMAVSMGANESYAKSELNKTYEFENNLAKITPHGTPNRVGSRTMDLSKIKAMFPFIPWNDYVNSKLPSNVASYRYDNITVANVEYIENLNVLMNSTPKRTVANYFVWKRLYGLKETFPNVNTVNYHTINKEKTLGSTENCLKSVSSIMPETLSNLYVHDYLDKNTETNVSLMFENIRSEFIQLLKHAQWIDNKTLTSLVEKTENMGIIMGYSRNLVDHLLRDEYVGNFQINGENNYFVNWLNAIMYEEKMWWRESDSIGAEESKQWKDFRKYRILPAFYYNPLRNVVYISTGSLQDIVNNYNFPINYINYGKVGFAFGNGIAHIFGPDLYNKDQYKNGINWSDESERVYQKKKQCIAEQYGNYNPERIILNRNFTDNNGGLRVTYNTYKKNSMMDESQELKGKNYTSKQLFWISVGNSFCAQPKAMNLRDTHSPQSFRVNGMFSNMEEFSDDFKCSKDSPMNRLNKCRIL